jgi:VWFA-related protein
MRRIALCTLLCGVLLAQQSSRPQNEEDQYKIEVRVEEVVAPTLVFDRDGFYVNGLERQQFHLFDNNKEQDVNVDLSYIPISLVIAVQVNSHAEQLLTAVKKIGNLIAPLVTGDQGEVALIAYDGRIRTMLDFTNDPNKVTEKLKNIYPGSQQNRLIDAVMEGTRMLATRDRSRRRIMLTIGETRDVGSESRVREALIRLQMLNIAYYSVDMSRFMNTLTSPPNPGRPDNLPPAMHPLPPNVPATPTTVQQTYGLNAGRIEFIPLMVELYKDAKAIFKSNPDEVFTKGTGGTEFGYHSQRTLETAIQKLGEELHSQYTLTYRPNNMDEGGFHEIKVGIVGHPDYKTQTRPGYWLPPKQQQPNK